MTCCYSNVELTTFLHVCIVSPLNLAIKVICTVVCEFSNTSLLLSICSSLNVASLCYCYWQRGKFRPRLTELVKGNSRDTVEEVTETGIALLPKLEAAIQHVSKLKGVGPATASGE